MPTTKTALVTVAALALAFAPVAVTAAAAETPAPRDVTEHACIPTSVAPSPYKDTEPADTAFGFEIACLTEAGVVRGDGDLFSPRASLTRGQLASLLDRADLAAVDARPAIGYPDAFGDDNGSVHEGSIDWAAGNSVVAGYPDGTFRPGVAIRRDQFASMVSRLDGLDGHDLPPGPDAFSDDDGSVHEDAINRLAASGVMFGTGGDAFSPAALLTRGQASAVLARLADVWVEAGRPWPLPANQLLSVDPAGQTFIQQTEEGEEPRDTTVTLTLGELQPGQPYRVVLADPAGVDGQPPANGPVRFVDADRDGVADLAAADARVVAVDGVDLPGPPQSSTEAVAGPDGTASVTVDNDQATPAVLVVFAAPSGDATPSGLSVDEEGEAQEAFGASGDLVWFFAAVPAFGGEG